MIELLASAYAAQVVAGMMTACPWFFNAYIKDNVADRILGTAMFCFLLATCAGRTWFWISLKLGYPAYQFLDHPLPMLTSISATTFLVIASSRCRWLWGRWWILTLVVTLVTFFAAHAV